MLQILILYLSGLSNDANYGNLFMFVCVGTFQSYETIMVI